MLVAVIKTSGAPPGKLILLFPSSQKIALTSLLPITGQLHLRTSTAWSGAWKPVLVETSAGGNQLPAHRGNGHEWGCPASEGTGMALLTTLGQQAPSSPGSAPRCFSWHEAVQVIRGYYSFLSSANWLGYLLLSTCLSLSHSFPCWRVFPAAPGCLGLFPLPQVCRGRGPELMGSPTATEGHLQPCLAVPATCAKSFGLC